MPDEGTPSEGISVDPAAVVAALEQGFQAEGPEPTQNEPVNEPVQDPGTEPAAAQTEDPLGPIPDLSDLTPEARAVVMKRIGDFQRGYTEKTTKLSDANRILQAAGGDPNAVLEAYEFAQTLSSDSPEGEAMRARLYQSLMQQYGQQGAPQESQETANPEDPFSDYDLPPEIKDRLLKTDALEERIARWEAAQEQQAAQQQYEQYMAEVINDLDTKYAELTNEFPDLQGNTPEEAKTIEKTIFALGAWSDGNLVEAVNMYRDMENLFLSRLKSGAVSVPGGSVTPPAGGGHSTEPVEINDLKDAGAATKEFLERAFAEGGY